MRTSANNKQSIQLFTLECKFFYKIDIKANCLQIIHLLAWKFNYKTLNFRQNGVILDDYSYQELFLTNKQAAAQLKRQGVKWLTLFKLNHDAFNSIQAAKLKIDSVMNNLGQLDHDGEAPSTTVFNKSYISEYQKAFEHQTKVLLF